MIIVVAAVIERSDRRLLIGQRRQNDTSPLKWEFPGGKVREGETPEAALARELQEELGVTLVKSVELGRVRYHYAGTSDELEIDRKSTRLNSSHSQISYAVFCLKKKTEAILRSYRRRRRINGIMLDSPAH